jgi:hypothetical protein
MDWLQRLGGRKFILALIAIAVATVIEMKTDRGLSPTMAGFLGTLVAAFSMANYAVTKKHMENRGGGVVDQLIPLIQNRNETDEKVVMQLIETLGDLRNGINDVKTTSAEIGKSVVNVHRAVMQKG